MGAGSEIITILERIEQKLDTLLGMQTRSEIATADDADLDGQYGDPSVRKNPPRWEGESFEGRRYSETTPEYLEALAGFLKWKSGKDDAKGTEDGRKYASFARKDAARALGWAKRLRAGWKAPAPRQLKEEEGW